MIDVDEGTDVPHVPTGTMLGSFSVARPDGLHDLVRAARGGDPAAVAAVLEGVRRAARAEWADFASAIIVAVPGHLPGPPNQLVAAAAEVIAAARGWDVAGDALRRTRAAPEAKTWASRDPAAEAATLDWRPPRRGRTIVLVDDVVRTGATLRACAMAIRQAGDSRPVVAMALARAGELAGAPLGPRSRASGAVAPRPDRSPSSSPGDA